MVPCSLVFIRAPVPSFWVQSKFWLKQKAEPLGAGNAPSYLVIDVTLTLHLL